MAEVMAEVTAEVTAALTAAPTAAPAVTAEVTVAPAVMAEVNTTAAVTAEHTTKRWEAKETRDSKRVVGSSQTSRRRAYRVAQGASRRLPAKQSIPTALVPMKTLSLLKPSSESKHKGTKTETCMLHMV